MSVEFRPARPRSENDRDIFFDGEVIGTKRIHFFVDSLPVGTSVEPFKPFYRFGLRGRYVITPQTVVIDAGSVVLSGKVGHNVRTIFLPKNVFPKEGLPVVLLDQQHENPREGVLLARPSTKKLT